METKENNKEYIKENHLIYLHNLIFLLLFFAIGNLRTYAQPLSDHFPAFPLKISENHRYLVDQKNNPFFIQADTPWSLFVAITGKEAVDYLENRNLKGFNAITVNLIEHWYNGDSTAYPYASFNKAGDFPFDSFLCKYIPDFSKPNDSYFEKVDYLIQKALEKGILVMMTPAYMGYLGGQEGWYAEVLANGPEKCRSYGRYLGKRYSKFPNVLWIMDGDRNPDSLSIPLEREIVAGIKESDSVHFFTAHCHPTFSSRDKWEGEPWLSINAVYTYNRDAYVHEKCLDNYKRTPVMPAFLFETAYEGEHNYNPFQIRAEMYWGWLCTIAGQQMGCNPLWKFGKGWQAAMDGQASKDEERLKKLVDSREWHKLIPDIDHDIVISGTGSGETYVAAALTSDANTLIAYIPKDAEPVSIAMNKITGRQTRAWWFDPRTGETAHIGDFPAKGSRIFQKPDSLDWVLVIDSASTGFKAPGK